MWYRVLSEWNYGRLRSLEALSRGVADAPLNTPTRNLVFKVWNLLSDERSANERCIEQINILSMVCTAGRRRMRVPTSSEPTTRIKYLEKKTLRLILETNTPSAVPDRRRARKTFSPHSWHSSARSRPLRAQQQGAKTATVRARVTSRRAAAAAAATAERLVLAMQAFLVHPRSPLP